MNTAPGAVGQQRHQPPRHTDTVVHAPQALDKNRTRQDIEKVNKSAADVDGKQKHQVHHAQENRHPQPAVENDAVNFVGEVAARLSCPLGGLFGQVLDEPVAAIGDQNIDIFPQNLVNGVAVPGHNVRQLGGCQFRGDPFIVLEEV